MIQRDYYWEYLQINEELIKIRGGIEMNNHYTCTFKKDNEDEGTQYSYYAESASAANEACLKDKKPSCTDQQNF